jgi:hypothetical protein
VSNRLLATFWTRWIKKTWKQLNTCSAAQACADLSTARSACVTRYSAGPQQAHNAVWVIQQCLKLAQCSATHKGEDKHLQRSRTNVQNSVQHSKQSHCSNKADLGICSIQSAPASKEAAVDRQVIVGSNALLAAAVHCKASLQRSFVLMLRRPALKL